MESLSTTQPWAVLMVVILLRWILGKIKKGLAIGGWELVWSIVILIAGVFPIVVGEGRCWALLVMYIIMVNSPKSTQDTPAPLWEMAATYNVCALAAHCMFCNTWIDWEGFAFLIIWGLTILNSMFVLFGRKF